MAGIVSQQSNQRRQSSQAQDTQGGQSRGYGFASGRLESDSQSKCFRSEISPATHPPGSPQSHYRHGSPPRSNCVSHAESRQGIRRQRTTTLRNKIPSASEKMAGETSRRPQPAIGSSARSYWMSFWRAQSNDG